MKNIVFNKDAFKKSVSDNVKNLYRKTLTEASRQEIFQAVSYTVKDVILISGSRHSMCLTEMIQRSFITCPWNF